jgi:hypothetical protein
VPAARVPQLPPYLKEIFVIQAIQEKIKQACA